MINYQLPISGNGSCIYNTLILLFPIRQLD